MKGDRKNYPRSLILIIAFAICATVFISAAYGSGDCKGQSCNDGGDVVTPVDVSTSLRDTSRAYGLGAGDVDINDCLSSWSIIVYQDAKPNNLCLALQFTAEGRYEDAAKMRCSKWTVRKAISGKWFGGRQACIDTLKKAPVDFNLITKVKVETDDDEDDDDETHRAYAEDLAALKSRTAKLESAKPRIIVQVPSDIQPQTDDAAERRARARAALKGEET